MYVLIIEPNQRIWEGNARHAILPAEDGEVCILDFHQPFLMRLKKGTIHLPGFSRLIKDGIAFMQANKLTLFVES